jgi:hypothetical protein
MKLYMFRTVPLSIIMSYSLYTQQWYMSYRQLSSSSRIMMERISILISLLENCLQACMTYHCCVYSEKLLMMDRGTVRKIWSFISKIKFKKLVHLVGFIIRKFVTMHGHMNVQFRGNILAHIYNIWYTHNYINYVKNRNPYQLVPLM